MIDFALRWQALDQAESSASLRSSFPRGRDLSRSSNACAWAASSSGSTLNGCATSSASSSRFGFYTPSGSGAVRLSKLASVANCAPIRDSFVATGCRFGACLCATSCPLAPGAIVGEPSTVATDYVFLRLGVLGEYHCPAQGAVLPSSEICVLE